MRLEKKIENLDYKETKRFFGKRADKYNANNPYSVTMYQDNNQELVNQRNTREIERLYPLLHITKKSKILDLACGIGRWSDAINEEVEEYCGIDFSEELIDIAKKRNTKKSISFYSGAVNEIGKILKEKGKGKYNTILLIGILMYLNDEDTRATFKQLEDICEEQTVICIREPIGIRNRLTLKDFYSEELEDNYNAIYRTREEIMSFFEDNFLKNGFKIVREGFLFDEDELNNRKETAQYYFVLER